MEATPRRARVLDVTRRTPAKVSSAKQNLDATPATARVLAERVPAFEQIKVVSSWAGLYEYNVFDQNAIIGFHPDVPNLVLANGFSGHGLQQSPATGRGVSELIVDGKFTTIDLRCFGYERIREGRHCRERNIV